MKFFAIISLVALASSTKMVHSGTKIKNTTKPRVLYNIHTYPKHYWFLKQMMDAWGSQVPPDQLLITTSESDIPLPNGIYHFLIF